uniref:Neurotransmitter-gated ion-channel ligand-binding domain-containing protein n=1 Tax=Molossus molossus TaxID=27622 RepID=A0A7J8I092_MOLMO|nr:hypothetical protein HJG59_006547 [Molossus molossus]
MEGGWPTRSGLLLCFTVSLLLQGRANTFTINCSGFDLHGVDPVAFQAVFKQTDFRPVTNDSIPTQVNISFTLSAILEATWNNPFISWDPEECGHINKLTVTTENLWLPDIFIVESWVSSMDVDQTLEGLSAYVTNDGHIMYSKPVQVTSICRLDIFYFPFDQQNCTLTFSSSYTQVAIRHRPRLYIINLLVPSSFLVAMDALSFYLPAESENCAPFKMTLLLGYNVFLLMMNKPASGTPLISLKEPRELVEKKLGPREAELNGDSGLTRAQLTDLWVQFSHLMDIVLFRLYLLLLVSSIITVIVLWST